MGTQAQVGEALPIRLAQVPAGLGVDAVALQVQGGQVLPVGLAQVFAALSTDVVVPFIPPSIHKSRMDRFLKSALLIYSQPFSLRFLLT